MRRGIVLACVALGLAGCSSAGGGSAPESSSIRATIAPTGGAINQAPTTGFAPSTPALAPDAHPDKKLIKLLYGGPFGKQFVTARPGEWIGIAKAACSAYGRVGSAAESQIMRILRERLSFNASRWFLAGTLTLYCPEFE